MSDIDFSAYLSEQERHDIAADEFRNAVRREIKTPAEVERFVGNVAYLAIESIVDEALAGEGDTARAVIAEKAATIIRNLTSYSVFRHADGYLRTKPSLAQAYLDDAVKENRPMIEKRVKRIVSEVGRDDIKWALKAAIDDAFNNLDEATP